MLPSRGASFGGAAPHLADMQGEHFAISDLKICKSLGVFADEVAVVVKMLGAGVVAGLCLDGAPECLDRHVWEDIESKQVLVVALGFRVGDGQCDAPTVRGG